MGTTFWRWSCVALGVVSIASLLCVGVGPSGAIAVVDDTVAASVFGQQSSRCGLDTFKVWNEERCLQNRVDLCTHLLKTKCAMGLCAYNCTEVVKIYPPTGIWAMKHTYPPCPGKTALTCTVGTGAYCVCALPTIAVTCFNNTTTTVSCN